MTRGGVGINELGKVKFWQLVTSEGLGTMLIVLMNNLLISRHDGTSVLLNTSIVAGLLYTVVLFMFGNHGYFNPAVTVSLFIVQRIPLFRMLLYMFSQVLGAMAGQAIATFVILPEAGYSVFGPGAPLPLQDLSLVKMFLIEMAGMTLVSAVISSHSECYIIGIAVTLATMTTFPFTMACLNPARSLAAYVVTLKFPHYHWVYMLAPIVGAIVGRLLMLSVEMLKVEPQQSDRPAHRRLLSDSE